MVVKRSGLFLVGILILSSFASAGLFEWFGNITGKATSGTAALNITVGNNAPTISGITFISAQTPTESGSKTVIFNFNVTDADGASNLNDSAAKAEFDNDGEAVRFNNSCVWVRDYAPNTAEYSCSVNMWYFDESGTWYVNVSSADINGAGARDDSTRQFTFNQLTSMVMSPTALGWGALGVANVNVGSNNDPIVVNNTGNDEGLSLNVTGRDLRGETVNTEYIYASNFSVGAVTEGCAGTAMGDSVSINVTSAILERGNNTLNNRGDTSGQEELFFCLRGLPQTISAQSYSSAGTGPWTIQIIT